MVGAALFLFVCGLKVELDESKRESTPQGLKHTSIFWQKRHD
jgi:hypothetical protein